MSVDRAWAYNERKRADAQVHALRKLSTCTLNPYHICLAQYIDRAIPVCECPCHGESVI